MGAGGDSLMATGVDDQLGRVEDDVRLI